MQPPSTMLRCACADTARHAPQRARTLEATAARRTCQAPLLSRCCCLPGNLAPNHASTFWSSSACTRWLESQALTAPHTAGQRGRRRCAHRQKLRQAWLDRGLAASVYQASPCWRPARLPLFPQLALSARRPLSISSDSPRRAEEQSELRCKLCFEHTKSTRLAQPSMNKKKNLCCCTLSAASTWHADKRTTRPRRHFVFVQHQVSPSTGYHTCCAQVALSLCQALHLCARASAGERQGDNHLTRLSLGHDRHNGSNTINLCLHTTQISSLQRQAPFLSPDPSFRNSGCKQNFQLLLALVCTVSAQMPPSIHTVPLPGPAHLADTHPVSPAHTTYKAPNPSCCTLCQAAETEAQLGWPTSCTPLLGQGRHTTSLCKHSKLLAQGAHTAHRWWHTLV